ncbi:hypothetical protein ACFSLT_11885 [Novosphingobium resinovorum]
MRASLDVFQKLAAANPRDPEAQIVIAGWHLGAVDELGGFLARTALGARTAAGRRRWPRRLHSAVIGRSIPASPRCCRSATTRATSRRRGAGPKPPRPGRRPPRSTP